VGNAMRTKKARRYDEQVEREIEKAVSGFSQHLMSNSKWIRLVDMLVANAGKILKIEFKKIQTEQIGQLYLDADITFEFDYWQTGFEGNNSLGGWLTFKEIEYLYFPRIVNAAKCIKQDLAQIIGVVERIGQFALESDEDGLKLLCYKK
jgi:hypothetical protein